MASKKELCVGCEKHTIRDWQERAETIGKINGYTADEIEEYRRYIELAAAMYGKGEEEGVDKTES